MQAQAAEFSGYAGIFRIRGFFRFRAEMAEGVGFEPTDPCGSPVFKTGALNQLCHPSFSAPRLDSTAFY